MELAIRNPDLLPAGDGDWLPLAIAAPMLECSTGHLRRECLARYEKRGLARKAGDSWLIHRLADDRLRRPLDTVQRDLAQIAELRAANVAPKFIEIAEAKRNIVRDFAAFRMKHRGKPADEIRRLYIIELMTAGAIGPDAPVKKLKPRQFINLMNSYQSGGLAALVPSWGGTTRDDAIGPEAWKSFLHWMRSGQAKTAKESYRLVRGQVLGDHAGDEAWKWPHYRTVLRAYNDRVTPAERTYHEEGPHKFRAKHLPKITRCLEDTPAGSHLCGDVRTLDFMARVPNGQGGWKRTRLKLTAWLDVRSRYLAGWCIADEANSDTILASFRAACVHMECVPDEVTIDNGKDYRSVGGRARRNRKWDEFDSKRILGGLERLDITVHYALVRHPWSKIVESWFTRVKNGFDKWFPSYWGGRHEERPWDADRWTREHIELCPTTLEVEDAFGEWLAAEHEQIINGDGMFGLCPRQAMRQYFTTAPRRVHADVLSLVCTRMHGPVKITNRGVRHDNIYYGRHDPEVWKMQGREVYLLADPVEADRVTLCDDKGVPLCIAYAERNLGQTRSEVRAAQRMGRAAERITKQYAKARDITMATPMQRIAMLRTAAAQSEQIPDADLPEATEPQTLRVVRSDIAAAASRVAQSALPAIRKIPAGDAATRAPAESRLIDYRDLPSDPDQAAPDQPVARRIDIRQLPGSMEDSPDA